MNLDYSKWKLLLSGGYDSRGILGLIKANNQNTKNLETVTWGLKESLKIKHSKNLKMVTFKLKI